MIRHSPRKQRVSALRGGTRLPVVLTVLGVVLLCGVLAYLWRDLARFKSAHREVLEENARLRERLAETRPEEESFPSRTTGPSSPLAESPGVAERVEPERTPVAEPLPEPNTLTLHRTEVRQTESGLVASMQFNPTTESPLDVFALVVRLPRGSDARILDLQPVGEATYTEVAQRVAEDGLFAAFHAMPAGLAPLRFELTVSKPVTATIRGTCGIEPFELTLQPGTAGARKI